MPLFYGALSAVLLWCAAAFVMDSRRWPLVGDAPLIHYCVFLMQHGLAPYREIVDPNQPGTFAVEAAVMMVLGKGALAWRVWDLLLLLAIGGAMAVICRAGDGPEAQPRDRLGAGFAAFFAAVCFALIHGRDGLIQLGQRDLLMAALLAGACALLLSAVRDGVGWCFPFAAGVCLGAAAAVKPDALLFPPALLALFLWEQRPWKRQLLPASLGFALPLLASLAFLLREHACAAYLDTMLHLTRYHASTWRLPARTLLGESVSSVLLPLFCLWLPVFVLGRRWRFFRDRLLLLGFLFGVFSFCVQGRGYPYHRYSSEVFLLLLAAIAFTEALRTEAADGRAWCIRSLAAAGLMFGALVVVPRSLAEVRQFDWRHDSFESSLSADLNNLGGRALAGRVQCLDMAGGCITTLYNMRLPQSTGYLYDCYLYPMDDQANAHLTERERYRLGFQTALLLNPPQALVVSSDECGPPDFRYRKLDRWPWLAAYLREHYTLVREEVPTALQRWGGKPVLPYGYRVYRRKSENPGKEGQAALYSSRK